MFAIYIALISASAYASPSCDRAIDIASDLAEKVTTIDTETAASVTETATYLDNLADSYLSGKYFGFKLGEKENKVFSKLYCDSSLNSFNAIKEVLASHFDGLEGPKISIEHLF